MSKREEDTDLILAYVAAALRGFSLGAGVCVVLFIAYAIFWVLFR